MIHAGSKSLVLLSVILAGGIFGFFYTWSVVVMQGLSRLEPMASIAAMQAINVAVPSGPFALIFFGTPIACAAAAVTLFLTGGSTAAACLLGAAIVYLAGSIGVTFLVNVPMNEALGRLDAAVLDDAAAVWRDYADPWLAWNHVRTAACGATLALSAIGLHLSPR